MSDAESKKPTPVRWEMKIRHSTRPMARPKSYHLLITAAEIQCQRCKATVKRPKKAVMLTVLHEDDCPVFQEAAA